MVAALTIHSELLPGAFVLAPRIFTDDRGTFVKTFHRDVFRGLGLDFEIAESFVSVSRCNVLRGMHFQVPPADHAKLVTCSAGRALDVILDLRKDSPTFGKSASIELDAKLALEVFIPPGFAHGFLALEEGTAMVYMTSSVHSPEHDAGVRWDGFGFDWPIECPTVSVRDQAFPALTEFNSPF